MNNDDNNKSSRVNTTPFNNNDNHNPFERVRNNEFNNIKYNKNNDYSNLTDEERKQKARDYTNSVLQNGDNINNKDENLKNKLQNNRKFGQGSTANNLRSKLNTIPSNLDDAKKKAVEKGAEALKKSADPLMKAAGYGLGAYQKHKDKKEKAEEKEDKEQTEEDNENQEDDAREEKQTTEEKRGRKLFKKMLPIIGICASLLLTLLVLVAVLSPVITAYSWFTSLFHHKNEDSSSYTIYNEKDSENYKAEQDYNNAILGSSDGSVKGIIAEYQEKYGVTIDWYLLNALITYKYTNDNGNIYSNDNVDELDEEEINQRLEELENSTESDEESESSSSDNSGVDFSAASKKIKSFASLMVVKEDGSYTTDIDKDGKVYNNVLNSNTYKKYYKSMFKDQTEESYRKILDEIYDYAESARELLKEDSLNNAGVISDTSIIHMQTCSVPYAKTTINGLSVYNNPLTNIGTEYPDYLNLKDYIKGTLMTEVGNYMKSEYKEGLKALGVVAVSFMLNDTSSGFNLKSGEMYFPTGNCRQVTCDPTNGCSYLKGQTSGIFGTAFVGLKRFGSSSGQHPPLTTEQNALLDEVVNDIFGKVIVKKGVTSSNFNGSKDVLSLHHYASMSISGCVSGHCLGQEEEMVDAKNGMDYMSILKKYFTAEEFDVIDITEGLYFSSTGNYNGTSNLNDNYHYYQSDSPWGSQNLCGINGNISGNGCNITSAAMAISILKNQRITPETLNNRQNDIKTCSSSSRSQMIMDFARLYGLNATGINKGNTASINDALQKLSTGNYIIVLRLEKSKASDKGKIRYYTTNGHYMTAVGVKTENGKNKLLVWDPAGKNKPHRDNYWADLETDLMPYLNSENSFILIGR